MKLSMPAALMVMASLCIAAPVLAEKIDFGKAVVIGSGPKTVVEFTDPDCPYCRNAAKYFTGRKDVTSYVFFNPLPRHPRAKEKAQYILSQQDKARAYHEIMSGRMDSVQKLNVSASGIRLQEEQFAIAKKAKVDSTPTFMINGRVIVGFDVKKIEEALGPK